MKDYSSMKLNVLILLFHPVSIQALDQRLKEALTMIILFITIIKTHSLLLIFSFSIFLYKGRQLLF